MATVELKPTPQLDCPNDVAVFRRTSAKIRREHQERLAVVYVRQSSPQQVSENRESTARQYALADHAVMFGWPRERVIVIDEDQGRSGASAEHRTGFQRLLAEVTLDHVGLVLGLEMSRLARSSKDWHHLLELCAIFGTLLADQDGVYDAGDPNDRLLLGLKGTMSEVELHRMRNRLDRGRLNKARRGEMFHHVPMGYVILPPGEVALDPDQQAQDVIRLVFEKFDEIGTIYSLFYFLIEHDIRMPVRCLSGRNKGELEWHRANISALGQMLHHPIYAGAYTYGRRPLDRKRKPDGSGRRYRPWAAMDDWKVLIKDRLPAYISWDHYLANQERLKQNQCGSASLGTSRNGSALLQRLIVCGTCGRKLQVSYRKKHQAYYGCDGHLVKGTEQTCYGLKASPVDDMVAEQVLRALEPAALELSLKAREDLQRGRQRLHRHWKQRLKRARYEVELAGRRYQAVDPENRLVASTLEKRWEQALREEREQQDEYDRFQQQTPLAVAADEADLIRSLASYIPTLWQAPGTTNADRQEIVRCLVDRVVVHVKPDSEYVDVAVHWAGGYVNRHQIVRPVGTYAQLRDFDSLLQRVVALREAGHTAREIGDVLNGEGFSPPKRRGEFTSPVVYQLLKRRCLIGNEREHDELRGSNEWWLTDLARRLQMSRGKLRDWADRGWVHSRKTAIQGYWILWADEDEVHRLTQLLITSRRGINGYPPKLITPKQRQKGQ